MLNYHSSHTLYGRYKLELSVCFKSGLPSILILCPIYFNILSVSKIILIESLYLSKFDLNSTRQNLQGIMLKFRSILFFLFKCCSLLLLVKYSKLAVRSIIASAFLIFIALMLINHQLPASSL